MASSIIQVPLRGKETTVSIEYLSTISTRNSLTLDLITRHVDSLIRGPPGLVSNLSSGPSSTRYFFIGISCPYIY